MDLSLNEDQITILDAVDSLAKPFEAVPVGDHSFALTSDELDSALVENGFLDIGFDPDLGISTAALLVERLARLPFATEAAASAIVRPLLGDEVGTPLCLVEEGKANRPIRFLREGATVVVLGKDSVKSFTATADQIREPKESLYAYPMAYLTVDVAQAATDVHDVSADDLRTRWRIALATEAGSTVIDKEALTMAVTRASDPRSTQEAAWTLLAAHALVDDPETNALQIDGAPVSGPLVQLLEGDDATDPVEITNTGADTPLTLTTFGVPEVPFPAGGYGYQITRHIFDLDGNEVTTGSFVSGNRYAVVLEVTPTEPHEARLIVDDPLPAGFEIDNPSLIRSGDVSSLSWIEPIDTRMTQFRSDRFVAAVDWTRPERFRLAYIVRAVTPGGYHAPAASVQDMYRPRYRAVSETGRITVTP